VGEKLTSGWVFTIYNIPEMRTTEACLFNINQSEYMEDNPTYTAVLPSRAWKITPIQQSNDCDQLENEDYDRFTSDR